MNSEHQKVLDKIRELMVESGVTPPWDESKGIPVNTSFKRPPGELQVTFDYGDPLYLITEEGLFTIGDNAIHSMFDRDSFWELFTAEFDVEITKPFKPRQQYESGPVVNIKPKI